MGLWNGWAYADAPAFFGSESKVSGFGSRNLLKSLSRARGNDIRMSPGMTVR